MTKVCFITNIIPSLLRKKGVLSKINKRIEYAGKVQLFECHYWLLQADRTVLLVGDSVSMNVSKQFKKPSHVWDRWCKIRRVVRNIYEYLSLCPEKLWIRLSMLNWRLMYSHLRGSLPSTSFAVSHWRLNFHCLLAIIPFSRRLGCIARNPVRGVRVVGEDAWKRAWGSRDVRRIEDCSSLDTVLLVWFGCSGGRCFTIHSGWCLQYCHCKTNPHLLGH